MRLPVDQPTSFSPEQLKPPPDAGGAEMTLLEHLEELRRRLIVVLVVVALGAVAGFVFSEWLMARLLDLATKVPGVSVQAVEVPEKFATSMRLALIAGIALAMPVIVYQIWKFVAPGLLPNERRYAIVAIPLVTVFFAGGVAFSYFFVLPAAMGFLLRFGSEEVLTQPRLGPYLSFVSSLLLWSGISFETPIFLYFLSKIGVLDWKKLSRWRKYAFLIICLAAAVITPTPDPVNMMIVAVPLYVLYEVGILLARFA
jgi:sec-independent protein translocase protein TatC